MSMMTLRVLKIVDSPKIQKLNCVENQTIFFAQIKKFIH